MKNLIEKKFSVLITNDGYLMSRWFSMPIAETRRYNKALSQRV